MSDMLGENAGMAIVIFIILALFFAQSRLGNGIVECFFWVVESIFNLFIVGFVLILVLLAIALIMH
jgi:hypothetical protein